MTTPAVVRVPLECLRLVVCRPSSWVTWVLLLSAAPLLSTIGSAGISAVSLREQGLFYDLAFLSILVGVVRGTAALTRIDGPLACASTRASFGIRAAVLGSFALLHAGIALLPVTLVESGFDASAVLGDAVRLSLVLMTTVAFGCLLLHLPLPPGSAPWILAVGAFVAPLLQPQVVPDRSLGLLACALLTAGWLLDHPPGRTA